MKPFQPSKEKSILDGILGIVFVGVGIFYVIPRVGFIGIPWTLMALVVAAYSFFMAFRNMKKGSVEMEDENSYASSAQNDTEDRLQNLRSLYDRSLITEEKFEEKRKQILEKL